jgi:hypothetical protein
VEIAPQRAPTCVPAVVRAGAAILRIFEVPEDAPILMGLVTPNERVVSSAAGG